MILDGNFPTTYFGLMSRRRLLLRACLAALALAASPAFAQAPAGAPVVVGIALPQTGLLADLAADLRKGLLLWQDEVNAGGGLLGRPVDVKLIDDQSESSAAGRLYDALIREHKADLLVGPFGSAASLGAAATAERAKRVLVNATGASRNVHRAAYRYVFQSATPLGSYGAGVLALAKAQGLSRLFVLAREDPAFRESAGRLREDALAQGLAPGEVEVHARGTEDFQPQVAKARAANADAWVAFGLTSDAAGMVKTLKKQGYAPKLLVLQGAADPEFLKLVGQDAEGALGLQPYDRRAATSGNAAFAAAYAKKWSAEAGLTAAEGYAAGKLLESAVKKAGSLDQDKLRETLAALEASTPLGDYKVDRNGAQLAARPLVLQVQRGRREIVWPEPLATAKPQPLLPWAARQPLK